MNRYKNFEDKVGYTFQDKQYLVWALTHGSVRRNGDQFERFEFLGDRVLSMVICSWIFDLFPKDREGDLSKRFSSLVCKDACEHIAKLWNIDKYLEMTTPEDMKNSAVLADATEALIGAIYLDGGFEEAQKIIRNWWKPLVEGKSLFKKDYKSAIQEWSQAEGLGLPVYKEVERSGPDHAPNYKVVLTFEGYMPIEGQGSSKKLAEQEAAKNFWLNQVGKKI